MIEKTGATNDGFDIDHGNLDHKEKGVPIEEKYKNLGNKLKSVNREIDKKIAIIKKERVFLLLKAAADGIREMELSPEWDDDDTFTSDGKNIEINIDWNMFDIDFMSNSYVSKLGFSLEKAVNILQENEGKIKKGVRNPDYIDGYLSEINIAKNELTSLKNTRISLEKSYYETQLQILKALSEKIKNMSSTEKRKKLRSLSSSLVSDYAGYRRSTDRDFKDNVYEVAKYVQNNIDNSGLSDREIGRGSRKVGSLNGINGVHSDSYSSSNLKIIEMFKILELMGNGW